MFLVQLKKVPGEFRMRLDKYCFVTFCLFHLLITSHLLVLENYLKFHSRLFIVLIFFYMCIEAAVYRASPRRKDHAEGRA